MFVDYTGLPERKWRLTLRSLYDLACPAAQPASVLGFEASQVQSWLHRPRGAGIRRRQVGLAAAGGHQFRLSSALGCWVKDRTQFKGL